MELQKRLLHRAARLLARRLHTRGEMRLKLARIAAEREIEPILDRLEMLNLLNDADYAYNFAFNRIRQEGWGPIKVRECLLRRLIASPLVESAIERVHQEYSEDSALEQYLEKCWRKSSVPRNRRGVQKLVRRLQQRGFHDDVIRNALMRKVPPPAWRSYDTGD